jgi:hypothetical protein
MLMVHSYGSPAEVVGAESRQAHAAAWADSLGFTIRITLARETLYSSVSPWAQ